MIAADTALWPRILGLLFLWSWPSLPGGHPQNLDPGTCDRRFRAAAFVCSLFDEWISPVPSGDGICFSSSKASGFSSGGGGSVQRGSALARSQAPPCLYVSPSVSSPELHPPSIFLPNTLWRRSHKGYKFSLGLWWLEFYIVTLAHIQPLAICSDF